MKRGVGISTWDILVLGLSPWPWGFMGIRAHSSWGPIPIKPVAKGL